MIWKASRAPYPDMEGYIRSLKTRYRRVSGRKNWNSYLLRYGRCVAYYDWLERGDQLCRDRSPVTGCRTSTVASHASALSL
jgi:hypothetical protein